MFNRLSSALQKEVVYKSESNKKINPITLFKLSDFICDSEAIRTLDPLSGTFLFIFFFGAMNQYFMKEVFFI